MTEAHIQARLEWAYAHENWRERRWRQVLFSDESTFTQFQQGRNGMVWREPGEELNPDCIAVTVKHSPSKMFWGVSLGMGLAQLFQLKVQLPVNPMLKLLMIMLYLLYTNIFQMVMEFSKRTMPHHIVQKLLKLYAKMLRS